MSEAERFCDEKTTVLVPSIALNYDGNMLESVGIGGEMFRRETPLSAENTRLKAENAKLRELVREMYPYVGDTCPEECKYRDECEGDDNRGTDGFALMCVAYNHIGECLRKLGIEVR